MTGIDLEARLGLLSLDAVMVIYFKFDHTGLENNIQKLDLAWWLAARNKQRCMTRLCHIYGSCHINMSRSRSSCQIGKYSGDRRCF